MCREVARMSFESAAIPYDKLLPGIHGLRRNAPLAATALYGVIRLVHSLFTWCSASHWRLCFFVCVALVLPMLAVPVEVIYQLIEVLAIK
jgi:hypothetical protein